MNTRTLLRGFVLAVSFTTIGVAFESVAFAAEPATQPAEPAAVATQPASRPASQPAALDPAVERILVRLEEKGKTIHDIQASIRYVKEDVVLNNKQEYEGVLFFKEEQPNPHFLIRFDKSVNDGVLSNKKEWHAFDGQWYIEARQSTQTIGKHQVLRPGEKVEVFRLGKGPFPLPFGQNKADILRHFAVKLVAPDPKDPPDTDHLECTPLPGTELARKYDTVHFWIDRKLEMPVKMKTVEKDEDQEITVAFSNPQINKGLAGSTLELPSAEVKDYSVTEDRLPEEPK